MGKVKETIIVGNDKDNAYVDAYNQYKHIDKTMVCVIIDLQNRILSSRQCSILFGNIFFECNVKRVTCLNLSRANVGNIYKGINNSFAKKYPKGCFTKAGTILTEPQIEISDLFGVGLYSVITVL